MPHCRILAAAAALPLLGAAMPATAAEVTLTSKITSVTIFPSGAEVTRSVHVRLDKGEVTAVLPDLPAQAIPGSLRIEGTAKEKLEIGAVDSRHLVVPRVDSAAIDTERKRLEDEIDTVRDERTRLQGAAAAAEQQKKLIANLASLPTRPAPASGAEAREDWAQVLNTIAAGSDQATRGAIDAHVKLRAVERHFNELQKKLNETAPVRTERTEVRVALAASAPTEADLLIRYQVPSASWAPGYDARLSTGTKTEAPKLELTRRATITQRTGEAWEDIAVELSTSRPTAGSAAPELTPVTVDFEAPPPAPVPMAAAAPPVMARAKRATGMNAATEMDAAGAPRAELQATVEQTAGLEAAPFQAVFKVPGRLTVPMTGDPKRVALSVDALEPILSVKSTPRIDARAYLYAKLTTPKGGASLLPGPVTLFRDGTFAGTGSLPLIAAGEDHNLGFGADDNVRVKYAVTNDKRSETGIITAARNDAKSYKITLKNLHERAVAYSVLDQIPVSLNQDIKVELNGRSLPLRKDVDDKRGLIAFEDTLAPGEERTIEFGTRVTWPAAKGITYGN